MTKNKSNPQSKEKKPSKTQHQIPREPLDNSVSEKVGSLKSLNAMLLKETVERRQQVDSLTQINGSLESELNRCESDNVLLQSELSGLTERSLMFEIEKGLLFSFLAVHVKEMAEVIEKITKENMEIEQLLMKVADLEKKCVVNSEKEAKMSTEIDLLVKEKQENNEIIQNLTQEKSLVTRDLNEAMKMLEHQKFTMDQEKTKMNDAKIQGQNNIINLKSQLAEMEYTIGRLETSNTEQISKREQLESEVRRYKTSYERARLTEKREARALFNKEKVEKISQIKKDFELKLNRKLSWMSLDTSKLRVEKKELEETCSRLRSLYAESQREHSNTQTKLNFKQTKLSLFEANMDRILRILKNTSLICNSKEDNDMGIDQKIECGEDIKNHVSEVEAIRNAFKDVKVRVAKAEKWKRFWTMVSFETTLLAFVSLVLCFWRWRFC